MIQLLVAGMLLFITGCTSTKRATEPLPAHWEHPDAAKQAATPAAAGTNTTAQSDFVDMAVEPLPESTRVISNPVPSEPSIRQALTNQTTSLPSMALVSVRDWCKLNGLAAPRQGADGRSCTITSPGGQMQLTAGTQAARWNGMDVHLGFVPQSISGQIYLQSGDVRSTVAPLLLPTLQTTRPGHVVVLDAGHGGVDAGTRSPAGGKEKDYTLDWALRLQEQLAADGWSVTLTRASDTEVGLSNRVALAQSAGASIFLSLHFNSAPPDKAGIETYCLTPYGVPSTLTRGYADEVGTKFSGNDFDVQNIQLAVKVHKALLEVNGNRDRGVRRARFPTVLRGQQCPALLIEGGYLSNDQEAGLIATPAHRQKLAEAVAAALRPFAPSRASAASPAAETPQTNHVE